MSVRPCERVSECFSQFELRRPVRGVSERASGLGVPLAASVHTTPFVARIFLMRTVCQVVLSGSHPSCLAPDEHSKGEEYKETCREGKTTGQTSNSTLSSVSIPHHERKWVDVEPGTFDQHFLEVSKLMIRLVRHDDSVDREEDGAVRFEDLASMIRSRNESTLHWSNRTCLSFLQRGGEI